MKHSNVKHSQYAFRSERKSPSLETLESRNLLAGDLVAGDANQDYHFDEADLIQMFQHGKYETGEPATWEAGDFNGAPGGIAGMPPIGDGLFNSTDFVVAFTASQYRRGPYDDAAGDPQHTRKPLTRSSDSDITLEYDPDTGDLRMESQVPITTFQVHSEPGRFRNVSHPQLNGLFDVSTSDSRFGLFPDGITVLELDGALPVELTNADLFDDLTVDGSYQGGGQIDDVQLICDNCISRTFVSPLGSGAAIADSFEFNLTADATTRSIEFEVLPGEYLTAVVNATDGLEANLMLVSGETELATGELNGSTPLILRNIDTTAGGVLTWHVSAKNDQSGSVEIQTLVNAVPEVEAIRNNSNNDIESAELIDTTFLDAPFEIQTSAILGSLDASSATPHLLAGESFEAGEIPADWTVRSDEGGNVIVSGVPTTGEGGFSLFMDATVPVEANDDAAVVLVIYDPQDGSIRVDNTHDTPMTVLEVISASGIFSGEEPPEGIFDNLFDLNTDFKLFELEPSGLADWDLPRVAVPGLTIDFLEDDLRIDGAFLGGGQANFEIRLADNGDVTNDVIWTIDTSNLNSAQLSFLHAEWNDDEVHLPSVYTGRVFGDGISVSNDGERWYRVFAPQDQPAGIWQRHTLDLSEVVSEDGFSLDGEIQIKFQQSGKRRIPESGRGYDDIQLASSADVDWYALTPEAGEVVSFVLDSRSETSTAQLRLYSDSGEVIADGQSAESVDSIVNNYLSDGSPLRIAVFGHPQDYTLFTIRNGQYEIPDELGIRPTSLSGNTVGYWSEAGDDRYGYVTSQNGVFVADFAGNAIRPVFESAGLDGVRSDLLTVVISSHPDTNVNANGQYFAHLPDSIPSESLFVTIPPEAGLTSDDSSIIVDALFPIDESSLQATDLLLDGVAATSASLISQHQARFEFQPVGEGVHTARVDAGSLQDITRRANSEIDVTYGVDTTAPTIVSTSIASGDTVAAGSVNLQIRFSEDVTPDASFEIVGLQSGRSISPSESTYDSDSYTINLTYDLTVEEQYQLTVAAENIVDKAGLTLDQGIQLSFATDITQLDIGGPLTRISPSGTSVYQSDKVAGLISESDVDGFSFDVDQGQVLTAIVDADGGLIPHVAITDPDGQSIGSNDNASDPFVSAVVAQAGTYTIQVSGQNGTTGPFHVQAMLNKTFESGQENNRQVNSQKLHAFANYGLGDVRQVSVQGQLDSTTRATITAESFEDGLLPEGWSTETSEPEAAVRVSNEFGAGDGNFALMLDSGPRGLFARRPAVLLIYDPATGEIAVDTPEPISTLEIRSASGIFTGQPAQTLDSLFDVDTDTKIFKLGPEGFGPLSFGNVAQTDLDYGFLASDLSINGSWISSGRPDFDIVVVEDGVRGEAIWTFDLSDVRDPSLEFLHFSRNDSSTHLPISYVGSHQGDGVSISQDGETWYRLFTPNGNADVDWIQESVNLTTVAQFADINLGGTVHFKFQHYGNGVLPDVGRGFDQIRIEGRSTDVDWYTIDLADGESSSIIVDTPDFDRLELGLYDASGTLIAETIGSDGRAKLQSFVDPTSDGEIDSYSIRLSRVGNRPVDYNFVSTINAGFHYEVRERDDELQPGVNLVYHVDTGQIDLVSDEPLTTLDIRSRQRRFQGVRNDFPGIGGSYFAGIFDLYNERRIFKLDPSGFADGTLVNFANIGPGLTIAEIESDLTVDGSLRDGGGITSINIANVAPVTRPTSFDITVPKSFVGFLNTNESDIFAVVLNAGATLTVETATQADGNGQFENNLDPALQLLSADGSVLATDDNGAADGRNALLNFTAAEAGTYQIAVNSSETSGEYVVNVGGDFESPGFQALRSQPIDGDLVRLPITHFEIQFNQLVAAESVQAADLLINGEPAAGRVAIQSGDTLVFDLPEVPPQGSVELVLPSGAIQSAGGMDSAELRVTFTYDTMAPAIVSTSIDDRNVKHDAGPLVIHVQLSESIDATMINKSQAQLVSFNQLLNPIDISYDDDTMTLSFDFGEVGEGAYSFRLFNNQVRDLAGNRLESPVERQFDVFAGVEPYLDGFSPVLPMETFAFESEPINKTFSFVDDEDTITFNMAAGQLITVQTTEPFGRHHVTLMDPSGRAVASETSDGSGSTLTVVGRDAGTYSIIIETTSGSPREYETRILLNQIAEQETARRRNNNSPSSAEPLDRFFRGELPHRVTVDGRIRRGPDWYSLTVGENENVSIGLSSIDNQFSLDLIDHNQNVLSRGLTGTNFKLAINELIDRSIDGLPSTYFIRVSSHSFVDVDYSLSVQRNAKLELSSGVTQLGPTMTVAGSIEAGQKPDEFLFHADSGSNVNVTMEVPTIDGIATDPLTTTLELVDPNGQIVAAGEAALSHVVSIGGPYRVRVTAQGGRGGYGLRVDGESVGPHPIQILQAIPDGQVLFGLPEEIIVHFSHVVDPSTVAAGDLSIGNGTATSVRQLGPTSFAFTVGAETDTGDGEYSVQLAADAISNSAGLDSDDFQTSFRVDRSSSDFDTDGDTDVDDLHVFCRSYGQFRQTWDINQDGHFDTNDYLQILRDIFGVAPGDITFDGNFDSQDLVRMFEIAKYETDAMDAVWTDGDFNCDGTVSTADLVLAFMSGAYVRPAVAASNVAGAVVNSLDSPHSREVDSTNRVTEPDSISVRGRREIVDKQNVSEVTGFSKLNVAEQEVDDLFAESEFEFDLNSESTSDRVFVP